MSFASGKSTPGASKLTNFSRLVLRQHDLPPPNQPACRDSPLLLVESRLESFNPFGDRSIPSGRVQSLPASLKPSFVRFEPSKMRSNPSEEGRTLFCLSRYRTGKGSIPPKPGRNAVLEPGNPFSTGFRPSELGSNPPTTGNDDSKLGSNDPPMG